MIHKEWEGIQWLEFELLAEFPLVHGCLMKHGGSSTGHWSSLNLSKSGGDDADNVEKNRKKVAEAFGLQTLLSARLVHGAEIASIASPCREVPIADGLATQTPGLGILVTQADCQAAIVYDPVHHAIANVHCGWKGSAQNVYRSAIAHMRERYQSNPEELIVCISPSLGPENGQMINYLTELPPCLWDYQIRPNYFDFWEISKSQLMQEGVLYHHIQIAGIDTYAQTEDYFSLRRNRTCGRQGTICFLKP